MTCLLPAAFALDGRVTDALQLPRWAMHPSIGSQKSGRRQEPDGGAGVPAAFACVVTTRR